MDSEVRNCSNCRYKNVPIEAQCITCIVSQKPRLPFWAPAIVPHPEEEINIHLEEWDNEGFD